MTDALKVYFASSFVGYVKEIYSKLQGTKMIYLKPVFSVLLPFSFSRQVLLAISAQIPVLSPILSEPNDPSQTQQQEI